MSTALGITEEQLYGELYVAWLKDTRERPSEEAVKRFRDVVDAGFRDKDVSLRGQRVGVNMAITLASLLSRSHVTKVDLFENTLRDTGCEAIAHLLREAQSITHVNLGGNDIGAQGITALTTAVALHKRLQVLILGSDVGDAHVNRIDAAPAKLLMDGVCRCKTLKVLDLGRNPIGKGSQEAFPAIEQLLLSSNAVQVLKLGHVQMSTESALKIVSAIPRSTSLTHLDLRGNDLGHQVGEALGKVIADRSTRTAPNPLKTVLLNDNPALGDRGLAPLFRALAADKGVATLDVTNCGFGNDAMFVLCEALATNASLTYLDVQRNGISRDGDGNDAIVELARSLVRHPSLQHLSLAHNKVKDDGACALASMLEANRALTHLDLDDCWVSDRGAVALGVALASNTSLSTLRLANNHISEDGGSAFAALLEKNRHLQSCALKGNSMFHNTVVRAQKLVARNRQQKQDEIPSKLRKEVIKLHYQRYKLDEARNELEAQRQRKADIDKQQERVEAQFRDEEAEYRAVKKQITDKLRDQEASCKNYEMQIRAIADRVLSLQQQHEAEMTVLQERYEIEVREREAAEEALKAMQNEINNAEQLRAQRIEQLKKDIEEAKRDREKWAEQTKQYRAQNEEAQRRAKDLEARAGEANASAAAAKSAKEDAKKAKTKGKDKASSDIANLLAASQ